MSARFVTRTDGPPELPSAEDVAEPVIAGGWWPDIDPAQAREAHRFRDQKTVTPARLRAALIHGILTAGADLEPWRAEQAAAGHARLGDVPAPAIDGTSRLVLLYRDAVALYAKARIIERYRDFDTTGAGDRAIDALEGAPETLRRDALHAIRDLKGRTRTLVELI
ncbi:head completion/stabilization protein [Sphingomonas morindae]|uniref:Head completion/stabilization protein n=1 Tax=Sphingomonas morindae TaxID=1541170 RepID=A0ABY4X749_9SPHN|nr:head completion/stabilization protein [Sphingomonas morindae]USI72722.1 head completion/stabilization protein [Sphingomonas morindae]